MTAKRFDVRSGKENGVILLIEAVKEFEANQVAGDYINVLTS